MDNKIIEIFIPGPAGRLEAKYYKSKNNTSPVALVLQPHPQYGGTMNNKVVVETFQTFIDNCSQKKLHLSHVSVNLVAFLFKLILTILVRYIYKSL